MKVLELSNGNLVAPESIRGVVKFAGKGVAIRNEFNKMLDFIKEPEAARQQIIVDVLRGILQQGRDWKQPDWAAELAKADKEAPQPAKKAT